MGIQNRKKVHAQNVLINAEKLKLSEQLYRLVVENSTDLVTLFDIHGRVIYASPSYKNILGYNPAKGTDLKGLASNKNIKENIKKVLKGNLKASFVVKLKHKNGQTVYLEETSSAISDEEGKPYLVVSTAHDISDRMALEKRKNEFITSASHELRTPITTIKSFAQILQKSTTDERSKHYLTKMNNQIDRLSQLVNDLLDVSKIESGKLALKKEKIEIRDLIGDIVDDMQYISNDHQIIFKTRIQQTVSVDKFRLSQVLVNLISNGIKFSPKANKIYIHLSKDKKNLKIRVQDFGIGIHKKDGVKIFEPFYQANNKIRQSYSGLGLGLHICAEIIKQHEGSIWVESQKGVGSTFIFTLPLSGSS